MYQFLDKTDNFEFLSPNLPKNKFCGQNFNNLNLDLESVFLRYHEYQFSDKTYNFEFLGPNLLDSESTPAIYHACQLSGKTDNF